MVSSPMQEPRRASGDHGQPGRLFLLVLSDGYVVSLNPDGSDRKVIVTECRWPDGAAVDVAAGHIYWTNMGNPTANDGSIERADFDGQNRQTIVRPGDTFTPKQLQLDKKSGKLYWCDREGMRLMRANLDGSNIETLVDASQGDPRPGPDATRWCVGVAVDVEGGKVYWTQKGADNAGEGRLFGAGIEIPTGQTASDRADIEVLYDGLPEPIDLELDLNHRVIYWTDRGDPPRGNTVNRAPMDADAKGRARSRDRVHALDGGNRHRPGCEERPNVYHRLWGKRLFGQARWIGHESPARRPGKPDRHRVLRNLLKSRPHHVIR